MAAKSATLPPRRKEQEPQRHVEEVEVRGHIIDSLILPKILDLITAGGGTFRIKQIAIGQAAQRSQLRPGRGAAPRAQSCCARSWRRSPTTAPCPPRSRIAGWSRPTWTARFPKASTARPTSGPRSASTGSGSKSPTRRWTAASSSIRDGRPARCVPMTDVQRRRRRSSSATPACASFRTSGARERHDVRVHEQHRLDREAQGRRHPRDRPRAVRATATAGGKTLLVGGPAIVHTGSGEHLCQLIRDGYINVLFAGNALATHDIEQALFGTSLGVHLDRRRSSPRPATSITCGRSTASAAPAASAQAVETGRADVAASCTSACSTTSTSCWPAASATTARCPT